MINQATQHGGIDPKLEELIEVFDLSAQQRQPVLLWDKNVIVSAGAGSGKTRTLVARYAALLYHIRDPRKVVAITFSDKAALEMRSRVRDAVATLIRSAKNDADRAFWVEMDQQVDSARISTIHSLCAEILRSHPAEAGIDPRAAVMEEAQMAALTSKVVRDTQQELANDLHFSLMFEQMKLRQVKEMLAYFINHRLRIREMLEHSEGYHQTIARFFAGFRSDPTLRALREQMDALSDTDLHADNRLDLYRDLRAALAEADALIENGKSIEAMQVLFMARKNKMPLNRGRRGTASEAALKAFRARYDELMYVFDSNDKELELLDDPTYENVRGLVIEMFWKVERNYRAALEDGQWLDFDSLEQMARDLLRLPHVRQYWQQEIASLLVDEFQDTNTRQRDLVKYLTEDHPGKLFMVGDARQSIYRFRQADVTVFKEVKKETTRNGYALELDVSYRTHETLVKAMSQLLAPIMGTIEDPNAPYDIQYTELVAHRKELPENIRLPSVALLVAKGFSDDQPRVSMGRMLAKRLLEMHNDGEIKDWSDVYVLCRTSNSFQFFEAAFEEVGIPYVTVAGKGFYDRPEVRDVLNMLRALADPSDDLALAGFLRSPAIGVSDLGLLQLRRGGESGKPTRLLRALQAPPSPALGAQDQQALVYGAALYERIGAMVDRVPVYELLKELIDSTHYRSILALSHGQDDSGREWRNIDKLLSECQSTRHLILKDYLDFVDALDEDGVRTGEAPAEAIGAVTIMSVHKSKGLERKIVVVGDINRKTKKSDIQIFLDEKSGLVFKTETNSLHFRVAKKREEAQEQSELNRLLYVAMTRSVDKLILCGHINLGPRNQNHGWMADINRVLPLPENAGRVEVPLGGSLFDVEVADQPIEAPNQSNVFDPPTPPEAVKTTWAPIDHSQMLIAPLPKPEAPILPEGINPAERTSGFYWDESGRVEGAIVHKAIEMGAQPGQPELAALLDRMMAGEGVVDGNQKERINKRVQALLARYYAHPICQRVNNALEKYHELPYTYTANGRVENGIIDLLFRDGQGWTVLDFKTNQIGDDQTKANLRGRYTEQLERYSAVLQDQMGMPVTKLLCFLDDQGGISLEQL